VVHHLLLLIATDPDERPRERTPVTTDLRCTSSRASGHPEPAVEPAPPSQKKIEGDCAISSDELGAVVQQLLDHHGRMHKISGERSWHHEYTTTLPLLDPSNHF
jgi:hypothetical protein